MGLTLALAACKGSEEGVGGAEGDGGSSARPPVAQPLSAVFDQATFTTTYTATVANPDSDDLVLAWGGTNCGEITTQGLSCNTPSCTSTMAWKHPHPPCGDNPAHSDATVFLGVSAKRSGKAVFCSYTGAETGKGEACGQAAFGDSVVGPDTSFAHVVYRITTTRCSVIQMIQAVTYKRKGPPETVVPHLEAMINDDGANLLPYVPPDPKDAVGGTVIDKAVNEFTDNSPYYTQSKPGSPAKAAELDDRPGNTKKGHKAYFEVCAFCSDRPVDADYGKILDCYSWEHDGDTTFAQRTEPQPAQKPTPQFSAALDQYVRNHRFPLPKPR